MGYTHYFPQQRAFTKTEWSNVMAATVKIFEFAKSQGIDLDDESDNDRIFFNGSEEKDESYETFMVTREHDDSFNFCKTALRPYDLVVCMVLLACQDLARDALAITSDGTANDWKDAQAAYKTIFGKRISAPWTQ